MKGGKRKMNKKGISDVVAVVLIILITVAAITIIWAAIIPMVKQGVEGGKECMDAQAQVSLGTSGYTCYIGTFCQNSSGAWGKCDTTFTANATGNISIQIGRGPTDFKLAAIDAIVYVGGSTFTKTLDNVAELPQANQEKVFILSSSDYVNATKIKIAPVITVGSTTKPCGEAQSITLANCA